MCRLRVVLFLSAFQVTGDSIYNLSRLAELETDKSDRPLDPPPKIISVEVGPCHAPKSLLRVVTEGTA